MQTVTSHKPRTVIIGVNEAKISVSGRIYHCAISHTRRRRRRRVPARAYPPVAIGVETAAIGLARGLPGQRAGHRGRQIMIKKNNIIIIIIINSVPPMCTPSKHTHAREYMPPKIRHIIFVRKLVPRVRINSNILFRYNVML
jgi:hypothetical protein